MAERLDELLLEHLEIPRETRPFQAHATVARIKTGIPLRIAEALQAVPPLRDASQAVKAMSLMRSDLHPQGAKYHRLKEFALAKSE
jgi:2'-5' RNA ligase